MGAESMALHMASRCFPREQQSGPELESSYCMSRDKGENGFFLHHSVSPADGFLVTDGALVSPLPPTPERTPH